MQPQEITRNLKKYFHVTADITIENGLVSCTGDVILTQNWLVAELPVQFKSVGGNFSCHTNKLESLTGAPQVVGGRFYCQNNRLTSLTGAPQVVSGGFACNKNQLESLTGAPRVVGGNFLCHDNKLESLAGAPHLIDGKFMLTYADNLPLLPLLNISGVTEFVFGRYGGTNQDLAVILTRWANTGTRGMVPCAMEMIKAGYRSNAKL